MVVELPSFVKIRDTKTASGFVVLTSSRQRTCHSSRVPISKGSHGLQSSCSLKPLKTWLPVEDALVSGTEQLQRQISMQDATILQLRGKVHELRVCSCCL
jgi:hypothetical protein